MKQVACKEQEQKEYEHNAGIVFIDMLCMPLVNKFLELVVLYSPTVTVPRRRGA